MIVDFKVENYRSFKDATVLSMEAYPLRDKRVDTIQTLKDSSLLPVVGIWGPNASGKSNIVKGLAFMQWAVKNSDFLNQPTTRHPLLLPFLLNTKTRHKPVTMEVKLWDRENKAAYRYGFQMTQERVVSEWLEYEAKANVKYTRNMLFTRDEQEFEFSPSYGQDIDAALQKRVLSSALALAVFAQFAEAHALRVIALLDDGQLKIFDLARADATHYALTKYYDNPDLAAKAYDLLKKTDLGIQEWLVEKTEIPNDQIKNMPIPDAIKQQVLRQNGARGEAFMVRTKHRVHGTSEKEMAYFDLENFESHGTKKLFGLAALVVEAIESGGVIVIDEFGAGIHPFVSRAIVELFQHKSTNPKGAQLIFTAHDTYLLSNKVDLRRDQIWFAEKNENEESLLHSLVEFDVRSDIEFSKNYLEGRFGAVPHVGLNTYSDE